MKTLILLASLIAAGDTKIIDGRPMTAETHCVLAHYYLGSNLLALQGRTSREVSKQTVDCLLQSTVVITWAAETFDLGIEQWQVIWDACQPDGPVEGGV